MKYRWALLLAVAHAVSPLQKVLDLLAEMKMKGALAIEVEKKQQAKHGEFCRATLKQKKLAIDGGEERIEHLNADLETLEASIKRLGGDLELHAKEILAAQAEASKTSGLREQQEVDHNETLREYEESMSLLPSS